MFCFFFFKQKTAYEMRIRDWSSDVCSSDLWDALREETGIGDRLALADVAAADYVQALGEMLGQVRPRAHVGACRGSRGAALAVAGERRRHRAERVDRNVGAARDISRGERLDRLAEHRPIADVLSTDHPVLPPFPQDQTIGTASCGERVCQTGESP